VSKGVKKQVVPYHAQRPIFILASTGFGDRSNQGIGKPAKNLTDHRYGIIAKSIPITSGRKNKPPS
jgi:hypothetical protein